MAYTIKRTNGSTITIEDNALDNTYGVQLIGKNRLGYGTSFNQNFFRLMENFSNSSSPSNPVSGQLWWDTAGFLKVYTGSTWKQVSSALVTEPATPVNGDLWLDTVNGQLKAYNGSTGTWITVGPSNAITGVQNGFVTETITPSSNKYIASMFSDGQRIAILSDQETTTTYSGLTNIGVGLTFTTSLACTIRNANIIATTGFYAGNVTAGNINNVSGILSVTGNATLGNIISAGSAAISGGIASTSTTTGTMRIAGGAGITGNLNVGGNASAGNLSVSGSTSITGNATVGANLSVSGNAVLGSNANVKITGGTSGDFLSTDGSGNLTWITPNSGNINIGTGGRFAFYAASGTTLSETSGNLTWSSGTNTLSLVGNLSTTNLNASGNVTISTNAVYVDAGSKRVGIGTLSPSYRTHIYQNDTNLSNGVNFYSEYRSTPASNPTSPATYTGGWSHSAYYGSINGSNVNIVGSLNQAAATGSGNASLLEATRSLAVVDGAGNANVTIGLGVGLNLNFSGNVQNHYGIYVRNPVRISSGNVSNNYGLYLENQSTGITNNYAVYSAGGINYFGGNVGIGTTSASATLTVNGTTNLGPIGNVTITGGSANQVLSTNGSGVLSWVTPSTVSSGTATRIAFYATSGTVLSETNAALTWNNSSNVLTVGGNISTSNISVSATGNIQTLEIPASGSANIKSPTSSTSSTSGALVVAGGMGIGGNIYVGTGANIAGNANVGNLTTTGNITAGYFFGDGRNLTNLTVTTANIISNGTSNISIPASGGNVNISIGGVANVLVVTSTGAVVAGNANVGNLTTAGNVSAGYFIGDGSLLTNVTVAAGSTIVKGTSNVAIPVSGGNVNTSVGGVANVFVVTSSGAVLAGNANVGNLTTTGNITAGYFFGDGRNLTNINVAAGSSIVSGTSNVVVYTGSVVATSIGGTSNVFVVSTTGANVAGAWTSSASLTEYHTWTGFQYKNSASDHIAQYKKTSSTYAYYWRSSDDGTTAGANQKTLAEFYNDRLIFYTDNAERIRIKSDGNVGIGNANPAHTLSVTGTLNVSGNANVGNLGASIGLFTSTVTATTFSGSGASLTSIPNSATTATSANTGGAIVARDASGNFSAGTVTADLVGRLSYTVTGTNTAELVRGNMADNDFFRILVGGTGSNAGYAEIATADDGTEPIYVRQYTGLFSSLVRTVTLLDGSGNSSFPGTLSATTFSGSGASLTSIPNSATTATSANTGGAIVARDASGNFSAGTITANLTGTASAVPWSGITSKPTTISGFGITNAVTQQDGSRSNLDYNAQLTSGFYNVDATPTNGPSGINYNQLIVAKGSDTGLQISGGYTHELYYRGWYSSGGTFTAWKKLLDSSNYNSYSPTLTGTGASGTWGINVTGTANNITAYTINQNLGTGNVPTFAGLTATGQISARYGQSSGGIANATGSLGGLECYGGGSTNAAFMAFHRPGAYAVYFGLDGTDLKVGGWSMGAVAYTMLNENNWTSYTSSKNVQLNSLGVGVAASGTAGQIVATGKIYGSGTSYRMVLPVGANYWAT